MSTVMMTACWPLQGMSATHKAVLISLADNANDDGVCWPSIMRISQRTCLSERAVRNALRWLEGVSLLSCHQRHGRSSWYTITPASYAPGTTCPPAPDAPQPRHEMPPTPAAGAGHPGTTCPQNHQGTSNEPKLEPEDGCEQSSKANVCPAQKIADLFNDILSPVLPAVVLLNDDRRVKLKARWNENAAHQSLDFWREYFEMVKSSPFLMGGVPGKNGQKGFKASFDWLIAPSNFVKVVEGNYHA